MTQWRWMLGGAVAAVMGAQAAVAQAPQPRVFRMATSVDAATLDRPRDRPWPAPAPAGLRLQYAPSCPEPVNQSGPGNGRAQRRSTIRSKS